MTPPSFICSKAVKQNVAGEDLPKPFEENGRLLTKQGQLLISEVELSARQLTNRPRPYSCSEVIHFALLLKRRETSKREEKSDARIYFKGTSPRGGRLHGDRLGGSKT
jgi:hypothetical protein